MGGDTKGNADVRGDSDIMTNFDEYSDARGGTHVQGDSKRTSDGDFHIWMYSKGDSDGDSCMGGL